MAALNTSRAQLVIDVTWEGGIGNFSDSNWRTTLSLIPLIGIDFNLRVDGGKTSNSVVNVTSPATIRDLIVSSGDTLNIANGQSLTLSPIGANGNVSNNGTISLSSNFNTTDLVISGGTVTFAGSGAITLGNHPSNRIRGGAATDHLVNAAGHTIQGSGQLGADLLTITNAGLIVANQSTDLIIDPSSGGLLNTKGTLRAANGATLILRNGSFNNTGGTIEAEAASHVDFDAAAITGGTLTSTGTGHFHASNLTSFANVTVSSGSNVEVPNGNRLLLTGTLTNQGTVSLLSSFNTTDLVSSGNVTLTGAGTIVLGDHPNNRIVGATAKDVLTNESNISGGGQLGADFLGLVNRGAIVANKTTPLTLDPSAAGFVNRGTLRATNGATLNLFNGNFTNSESGIGGTITADSASRIDVNNAVITDGTLSTSADSQIRNIGTVTLGNVTFSAGTTFVAPNDADTTLLGTIANHGSFFLQSSFNNTDVIVSGGNVSLEGSGTISFTDHPNNRIVGAAATDRLTNQANTIQGAGQIGADFLQLTNRGTIRASAPTNALVIDLAGTSNVNSGTLAASPGATLVLQGTTLDNFEATANGLIRADSGIVRLQGSSLVRGGNVDVLGAGEIQLNGSTLQRSNLLNGSTGVIRATGGLSVLDGITLTNPIGGRVILDNDADLQLNASGTYLNSGLITLNSSFYLTDLIVSGGDVVLSGGGTVRLGDHSNNRIIGAAPTDRLVNENNTIEGSGQLGQDSMGFVNRGAIVANQPTPLTLNPSAAGVINRGVLRGSDGVLNIVDGTVTNSESGKPGLIEAISTGRVDLDGTTIVGGTFSTSGKGVIRNIGTTTLDSVSIAAGASVVAINDADTTLLNTLQNSGTLSLESSFHNTDLLIGSPTVTLTGNGTIALSDHGNNRILGTSAANVLVNENNTITGSGQLGADQLGLINRNLIVATRTTALTLNPSAAGVVNRGTLRADGGTLNLFDGIFTNSESGISGTIEARDNSSVQIDAATISGGVLSTIGTGVIRNIGTATLANVTLRSGTLFTAQNDADTTLVGTLTNHGTLALNSSFHNTDLILSSGDVTLTGNGAIALSDHGNNRIVSPVATHRLINLDNTISGGGQIGANSAGLVNLGLILADKRSPLTIDPSAAGVVNRGVLRADNATLNLFDGNFTNEKDGVWGLIEATNGGRVHLNAATLSGGMISSDSGSVIRNVGTATLERVLLAGGTQFAADNGTVTTLIGQISNYGTISLNSSFHNTDLVVAPGGVTLDGFGTLALSNHGNNRVLGNASLTNASGHTIRGSGQLGAGQITLTNHGNIVADQSTPLTIDVAPTAAVENHGMLRATNGASLVVADHISNRGLVLVENASTLNAASGFTQSSGVTLLDGGTFTASSATFSSGLLHGSGTINGPITNGGVLSPGTSERAAGLGLLTFNQSLTLTPTSLLHFEIGSSTTADRIQAQSATLDGALVITFATGFSGTLLPTDTFTLLATTGTLGLSGTFTGLANGSRFFTADGAGSFQVNYLNNALTISAFQPIPEPSTYALLGLGAVAVLVGCRRRRR